MSRDAKELCLFLLFLWVLLSGLWSCGGQIGTAAAFVYKHVVIK